jgi:hypothetical protein
MGYTARRDRALSTHRSAVAQSWCVYEPSEAYLPEPAELQDEPTMNLSADPAPK